MLELYRNPYRVYLALGLLAALGVYAGLKLPISLFPNSTKPNVGVTVTHASVTSEEFRTSYGDELEGQLRGVNTDGLEVEDVTVNYDRGQARYGVDFAWGADPKAAEREIRNVVNAFAARFPDEMRRSTSVHGRRGNSGFLAISFYSPTMPLDDIYAALEPMMRPGLAQIKDASSATLWNPNDREIRLELKPETMASLSLLPRDVERAISQGLSSYGGGDVKIDTETVPIQVPRHLQTVENFGRLLVATPSGRAVPLSDVAKIELAPVTYGAQSFKTSGAPSIILFATPAPDANVKRMAESILAFVESLKPSFPAGVEYKVLVDPSQFIRASIVNVLKEVAIGAGLAVVILFFFIGSFKNTVTAAIEIPISMVLAFILMRMSGMNLNLISLGGLALSAGMNVDASVVVMENIFSHFERAQKGGRRLSLEGKLRLIAQAVAEVRLPVIASTIASLVVFLPLAFTSSLTYAILGDLAKTVVFSHGFSAVVALILVPTVRFHLLRGESAKVALHGGESGPVRRRVERFLGGVENLYIFSLRAFARSRLRAPIYGGLVLGLVALCVWVLPKLPREVIGIPDSDWMVLSVSPDGYTMLSQMEAKAEAEEARLLEHFGASIDYTFTQIQGAGHATILARMRNRADMLNVWKGMQKQFTNTPDVSYWVGPWNPAELPIPDPPKLRLVLQGGKVEDRAEVTQELRELLDGKRVFPDMWTRPNVRRKEIISLVPYANQFANLKAGGSTVDVSSLADLTRVATNGRWVGYFPVDGRNVSIQMSYPPDRVSTAEDVGALPISVGQKIIPLKALADVRKEAVMPTVYRENGAEVFLVLGDLNKGQEHEKDARVALAKQTVEEWRKTRPLPAGVTLTFDDPEKELTVALEELVWALAISVLLIFVTIYLQFNDFVSTLIVMVSVPLGVIGVMLSLWLTGSTLSLNSVLGVILLNGLAVANSILLVDFLKRQLALGLSPLEAALEAGRKRLRPILITSFTTILAMCPIAFGMGEGGRILQPLGIAVAGGLWFSMALTLFVVPSLQVAYLNWRGSRGGLGKRETPGTVFAEATGRPGLATPPPFRAKTKPESASRTDLLSLLFGCLALGVPLDAYATSVAAPAESPLKFEAALARIVERDLGRQVEAQRMDEFAAKRRAAQMAFLPSVSASGARKATHATGATVETTDLELSGTMNLFRFGADWEAIKAARADENAQTHLVEQAEFTAERAGVAALLKRIQNEKSRQILKREVESQQKLLEIARERYRRGLLSGQEADKVAIDLAESRASLRDREVLFVEAEADLREKLGTTQVEVAFPWEDRLGTWRKKKPWLSSSLVLAARPDWQAASLAREAADARKTRQFRGFLPTLNAVGAYGRYDLSNADYYGWSAGLTLSVPLFDQLVQYSAYQTASVEAVVADYKVQQVERDAASGFASARHAFEQALESAFERDQAQAMARRISSDNLKRFQAGRISANDLIIDQRRQSNAELSAIDGWTALYTRYTDFCHALGKRVGACF
ncbi:MAG: efflux RND transporter permease subunit [Bacteriovoracia bacterium]